MSSQQPIDPPATTTTDDNDWPTDPSKYELIGKIGHGAFATVYKAKTISSPEQPSKTCAVKILNLDHVDTNLDEIRLEVQAMRLSSHDNVLMCHTAFCHATNLWLVAQLMNKGSSIHCLQTARKLFQSQQPPNETTASSSSLPPEHCMEQHILYILQQTLLGLQYIHDNGQIHRDIKASNILLDDQGQVRIADFGVSGWLVQGGSQLQKAKTFVGTPCWMAPEVMEQVHGYDYKADIWSLGITALELAKGYAPYAKYPPMKVLILTIQEDPPNLDTYLDGDDDDDEVIVIEEYSKSFRQLIDMCLQKDPSRRPTTQALLQSKYLTSDPDKIEQQRQSLVSQVCDLVPDVGMEEEGGGSSLSSQQQLQAASSHSKRLPGQAHVSFIVNAADAAADRPAGTTWVFADGSQVLSSSATTSAAAVHSKIDDVMAELDEFGKQTGGEHYNKQKEDEQAQLATVKAHGDGPAQQDEEDTGHDDLDAFMDEFEQNTAGEDFRHPSKR